MLGNPTELCFLWKILKYWLNLSLVAFPPPFFLQFCWNIFYKPDPGKYNHVRLLKPFSRGGGPEYKEQNNYLLLAEGPSVARE